MQPMRMEHFITYTSAPSIDAHLDAYRQAGFHVLDHTVRHDPGLRNGFLGFGPEYVEFCWVEDEDQFASVGPEERVLRAASRPYSIGIVAPDANALHDDWAAQGYEPAPVWSKGPADAAPDAPPVWSFQEIPAALLPGGAECFVLTYHKPRPESGLRIAPNTTYAIDGDTFVTAQPDERARAWGRLLAPDAPLQDDGDTCSLRLGPHRGVWMTPAAFERRYGVRWQPSPHPSGELAVLHLLAEHLATAEAMLSGAGRVVSRLADPRTGQPTLFVAPDPSDGFAFLLSERPSSEWLAERTARFGDPFGL